MNIKQVTLEECISLHERFGIETVIRSGEVLGFEKFEKIGNRGFYFSYSHGKHQRGCETGRFEKDPLHMLLRAWNHGKRSSDKGGVIAGRKEDLGKVAALYAIAEDGSIGEFLGYYDFYDTGAGMDSDGDGIGDTIRTGKSVDVFQPSMDSAVNWIKKYGDYVYIVIIEAQG